MNCEIQVEQILLEFTGVNFEKNSELKNMPFFGKKLHINTLYMVLVLMEIEKEFNIHFPEDEILKGNFNTFNSVMILLNGIMNKK